MRFFTPDLYQAPEGHNFRTNHTAPFAFRIYSALVPHAFHPSLGWRSFKATSRPRALRGIFANAPPGTCGWLIRPKPKWHIGFTEEAKNPVHLRCRRMFPYRIRPGKMTPGRAGRALLRYDDVGWCWLVVVGQLVSWLVSRLQQLISKPIISGR